MLSDKSRVFKTCEEISIALKNFQEKTDSQVEKDAISYVGLNRESFMFLADLSRLSLSKTTVDMLFIDEASLEVLKDAKSTFYGREVFVLTGRTPSSELKAKIISLFEEKKAKNVKILSIVASTPSTPEDQVQSLFVCEESEKLTGFGLEIKNKGGNEPNICYRG